MAISRNHRLVLKRTATVFIFIGSLREPHLRIKGYIVLFATFDPSFANEHGQCKIQNLDANGTRQLFRQLLMDNFLKILLNSSTTVMSTLIGFFARRLARWRTSGFYVSMVCRHPHGHIPPRRLRTHTVCGGQHCDYMPFELFSVRDDQHGRTPPLMCSFFLRFSFVKKCNERSNSILRQRTRERGARFWYAIAVERLKVPVMRV